MPNFRRKFCHQCRSSKLACDRKQPKCSRCERRGSQCRYSTVSNTPRFISNESRTPQETPLHRPRCLPERVVQDISTGVPISTSRNASEARPPQVAHLFPAASASGNSEDFEWPTESRHDNDGAFWPGDNFLGPPSISSSNTRFTMDSDVVADIIADINTEISKRANFEYSQVVDHSLLLRPRRFKTMEASLVSKMMLGTICGYPDMLVDGLSLPPFMYPPCRGDELRCQQSGFHQCPPQCLAACASIVRMFKATDYENKAFVWRTMYMEQQKLFHEHLDSDEVKHESYEKETLLSAVQAVTLYTILHISDAASVPKYNLRSLVVTLGVNPPIHFVTCHVADITHDYTINELLSLVGSPSSGNGGGACKTVGLPSTRSLWAAKTNVEWQRNYTKQAYQRLFKEGLKIVHLREYTKLSGDSSPKRGWMSDFETWCSDHDDFGTLIWMATRLDPL
ncbi:C6 finger domain-containing protein [Colletotrichum truncatum]|uniref:C6 finger domain-containing protein n=1 Tax=Colletotrichum truncatum TaxID=5467 RepID=A0ACC3Z531_COLTU